ncbi:MAG TPA: hypothetical protein PLV92_21230, partial [Pirellulaceae bacterium]|nr:hypothetical protein [Pirellulaceae bacterium]
PRVNSIRVTPDGPPTVQIVKPGVESVAAPGDELPVAVRAADDHGLSDVRLEWKVAEAKASESQSSPTNATPTNSPPSTAEVHVVKNWPQTGKATTAVLTHAWKLDASLFQPGQIVMLRAVAKDARQFNRRIYGQDASLAPQETASAWHRVKIVAADERAGETLSKLESINSRLWQVLQNQLRARVIVAGLMKRTDLAEARLDAQNVRQKQVQVQTAANDLVGSINPNEGSEFVALRQALAKLAHGDMIVAVQCAEALTGLKSLDQTAELAPPLAETQERVIDILRRLLDASRRATSDVLSEMKERPGQDLPPDVQQKLKDLHDKLQEFLKQQKKIIEATENLAKKPVEDFTEEDEQKLKEMAQAEDDWSRFMEEAHSDLSKLPEQDFANPSMLEEMIEVMTELKMAEGALTKKTADIAVPLEQLGAEMAEQMTTNIEKWLPDTPDRERWSQEEPISDEMKEAPMAELPGELEDIVGELMEDEEDLFDEMEDASSSWADSLDKGAGWDAMDGPISNMSARGVTGNRLPNSSEIGELMEDEEDLFDEMEDAS